MSLVQKIEDLLTINLPQRNFNKITVTLNEEVFQLIEKELYRNVTRFFTRHGEVTIEQTVTKEPWIYFTFYDDYNLVDFMTIDVDELELEKVATKEVPKSTDRRFTPSCEHQWKTTLGLYKQYKDCVLCKMKWEDFNK